MGLPFFQKAVELQQKFSNGKVVGNDLQTNGLYIDEEWAGFFRKYNFIIELPIDGSEHIHDHYGYLKKGQGVWRDVSATAKLLLDNDVTVNALSVITDYSINFPEEIYYYLKESGLVFMQFIPCVEIDPSNSDNIAPFSVDPLQFGEFLINLFYLWLNDFQKGMPTTSIHFFESLLFKYAGVHGSECSLHTYCNNNIHIEYNGDVYPCDYFISPEMKLGNIENDNIVELLNTEKQKKFGVMKAVLSDECNSCEWLKICRGGCQKDRIYNVENQYLNYLCPGYKYFFEKTNKSFKELICNWEEKKYF